MKAIVIVSVALFGMAAGLVLAQTQAPSRSHAAGAGIVAPGAGASPANVVVVNEPTSNANYKAALAKLLETGVLDKTKAFFESFRLPRPLRIITRECRWGSGAFYFDDTITVCYGYLEDAIANARNRKKPSWVSEDAAIRGQFLDVFIHEGGHAVFDQLRTPLFAKEEDAADTFASYAILNLFRSEAPQLVNGILYSYLVDAEVNDFREVPSLSARTLPSRQYGGAHSTPHQRLFNLVCLASGFDEALFRDVVARSDLPGWRSRGCDDEIGRAHV